MRRIVTAAAALAGLGFTGCATQTALLTREERIEIARRGPEEFVTAHGAQEPGTGHQAFLPPPESPAPPVHVAAAAPAARQPSPAAPTRTVIAASAPARPQAGGNARRTEALPAEERGVADAYYAMRGYRDANTRLAAALAAYDRDPSPARDEKARRAFDAYQESAKMNRMSAVVVALSLTGLTGCNTISSQIRALNEEEKEIIERATAYQEHRKSIVALVAALEQVKRDGGTSKSEHAVEEARARYEQTAGRL